MKIRRSAFGIIFFFFITVCQAQDRLAAAIFAHNDYVQPVPFYNAYNLHADFIEADIFLRDGKLLVAHTLFEIDKRKTLDSLYLKPLVNQINKNKGLAYADGRKLVLMLDLKTDGDALLKALILKLKQFPELLNCKTLSIAVSGDMPAPSLWDNYPDYILFDGRPGINYTEEQLERIVIISDNLRNYAKWNGKGLLMKEDKDKVVGIIEKAHKSGKKIRFWEIPDFVNSWTKLISLGVDVLNTDHVAELSSFLKNVKKNSFMNSEFHELYEIPSNIKYKSTSPKNIILMIGDGTGLAQIYSGYTANKGKLNVFGITNVGLSITASTDSYITDSAAGATAMSTGKKTNNRFIGVDPSGKPLVTIAEELKKRNYKVGVISNGDITDATPASFYAHRPERSMSEEIAGDFLTTGIDILIGGGSHSFNNRKDKRDLFQELKSKGYSVINNFKQIDTVRSSKFVVIDDSSVVSKIEGRGDFLSRSLNKTFRQFGQQPFFIMLEGAKVDHGGHDNDLPFVVTEMLDFDKAIGEAMRFVDTNKETLLIVTADHETGGLSLLNGEVSRGEVYGNFSSNDHSSIPVPVFAYGPGAENFRGVYQNTAIYTKMMEALKRR